MDDFNLIENPWIPVRWKVEAAKEQPSLVSLRDAFVRGREIADLDCAPHERISLMRLLVCIAHAALGAPEEADEWEGGGEDAPKKVIEYLLREEIFPNFNLLGYGPRFLQEVPKSTSSYGTCKLFFEMASGNNPTLLDHWGEGGRDWNLSSLARALICLQNFFVGGSLASQVKGNGPSLKFLHLYIRECSLLESVLANCVSLDLLEPCELGKPTWEGKPEDTLLGRLSPVPCRVWISDNLESVSIEQGFQYSEQESFRDPYSTIQVVKEKRRPVRADTSKGIWRDLPLLVNIEKAKGVGAAYNLVSYEERNSEIELTRFWVGELIKHEKLAKILDAVESVFTVPDALFDTKGRGVLGDGVAYAESVSKDLRKSVWVYFQYVTSPDPKGSVPGREIALRHFWNRLDQDHRVLIELAGDPNSMMGTTFGVEGAKDAWTLLVRDAAFQAYQAVCPQTTPRQIQAYSLGIKPLWKSLYPKSKAKNSGKSKDLQPA